MTARFALFFSIIAAAAAIGALSLLVLKMPRLMGTLDRIDRRLAATPAPAPAPPPVAPSNEENSTRVKTEAKARRDLERIKVVQAVEKENEAYLADLVKKLGLTQEKERELRAAFTDELSYYVAGVERNLAALWDDNPKAGDNWLSTPEFKKGLEKRISATDEKARELLTAFQTAVFEQWRREYRRNRYDLE
ncbi:MAG TPA: hypothetical protein VGK61_09350 [Planctomycetota bacterium]|jgi:hypothetical protein